MTDETTDVISRFRAEAARGLAAGEVEDWLPTATPAVYLGADLRFEETYVTVDMDG